MNSVNDIQHILYINLDSRLDRNMMALQEFEKLAWATHPQRVRAIPMAKGAFGCSLSHIQCLEWAKKQNWDHVLICEDDVRFTNPALLTENLNLFLASNTEWDVLLLGGNNFGRYRPTGCGAVQIEACLCALAYLVKRDYYDTLLQNMKEGLACYMREPSNSRSFALDTFWFRLQVRDKWFLVYPLSVTQQQNYSDIENRNTNYDHLMLTLDKHRWKPTASSSTSSATSATENH